jgi:colanic acid/amylovoran biosynthesis protein
MRILVEHGDYMHSNLGDMAQLAMGVRRLRAFWPDAQIDVMTRNPAALQRHLPETQPVRVDRVLPSTLPDSVDQVAQHLIQLSRRARHRLVGEIPRNRNGWLGYVAAARRADVVFVAGGGYINDIFTRQTKDVFETLTKAREFAKPVFMFGQGIDPIHDETVEPMARVALPYVHHFGLREADASPTVLSEQFGISADRLSITGDDSIELAYEARGETSGTAIGINLRPVDFAAFDESWLERFKSVVHAAAHERQAPLIRTPIHIFKDAASGEQLVAGYSNVLDAAVRVDSIPKIFHAVGQCRIVVTGVYHAAVFALSQGKPAVCLHHSEYYRRKFTGLARQFGAGCSVVDASQPDWEARLMAGIDSAWEGAQRHQPDLLKSAAAQIQQATDAYQTLYEIVEAHRSTQP